MISNHRTNRPSNSTVRSAATNYEPSMTALTSEQQLLAVVFAEVVGDYDRLFLIDAENKKLDEHGWLTPTDAVRTGRPYVARRAPHLAVIDIDEGGEAALRRVLARLGNLGLNPVVCGSGGIDRYHVFVRVPDGLRPQIKTIAVDEGLDHRPSGHIRPPLAPHRSGSCRSELLDPTNAREALERLVRILPGTSPRLSRLIVCGDVDGQYDDRSGLTHAIARLADNEGVPRETLAAYLEDERHRGGERFREEERRNARGGSGYLELSFDKFRSEPTAASRVLHRELQRLRCAAALWPWPGRTGPTDRAVFVAHLDKAVLARSADYRASDRELSERARVNRRTARLATQRLIQQGWLKRVRPASPTTGTTYELDLSSLPQYKEAHTPPQADTGGVMTRASGREVFRHGMLTKSAGEIYDQLCATDGLERHELEERTGRSSSTIRRALKDLSRYDLAGSDGKRWFAGPADLKAVSVEFGAYEKAEAQKQNNASERTAYRKRISTGDVAWLPPKSSSRNRTRSAFLQEGNRW